MNRPTWPHREAADGSEVGAVGTLRLVVIVTVLVAIGAALGWGTAHWLGSGAQTEATLPPHTETQTQTTSPSQTALPSDIPTKRSLMREPEATSTPRPLAADAAVPDESVFQNGEVTVPEGCVWAPSDDRRLSFTGGTASLGTLPDEGSVTVRQTAVVTLEGKAYRAVDFACWGGGNLVYDMIGLYDETGTPVIQTDVDIAAGPYQNNAISPVEGSLKSIENGFHLQWAGEFLDSDGICAACATGYAEADFVWNGGSFDVVNKTTWQERV